MRQRYRGFGTGFAFRVNCTPEREPMRTLIIAITLLSAFQAGAQNARLNMGRTPTVSGGLEIGIPRGEFNDTWGRELVGFGANMALPMRLLPLDWGFDFGYAKMGGERSNIPVEEEHLEATEASLRVNANVYSYHGLLRFRPIRGQVSPYVDAMAGLRHFTTNSEVRVDGLSEPVSKERRSSNFTGSAGWAVGVMVGVSGMLYVEGRVERITGGKASYIDGRTISITPEGEVTYETLSSKTSTVNVHLGIGFKF